MTEMENQSLKSGSVGFWQLTYQSISLVSPAGAMAATLTGAAAYALGALPLTYILAIIAAAFTINTTVQFSRHIASAGGFYNYVSQGWASKPGILTGWLFVLSYFMVVTNAILFVAGVFIPGLVSYFHGSLPSYSWLIIMALMYLFVWYFAYHGIRPSLQYSLWTGAVEILVLVVVAVGIIISPHTHNTAEVFTHPSLALHGWSGVGIGMILAMFSMSGSSGAVTLGEEAHQPHRLIRNAVMTSFGFAAGLFILVSYALTTGWGPAKMSGFASASIPGVILARQDLGLIVGVILLLFIINSLLAGSLAPQNSLVRMVFAFARDGVLPAPLKKVHPQYRSPHVAVAWATVLGFVISLVAGLLFGPFNGFLVLATISSVALFVGHILANIALPIYYRRRHQFRWFAHGVAPIVSTILVLLGIWFTIYPFPWPVVLGPIIVALWILFGLWRISRLTPEQIARAGQFNVPHS
ncbi:APC family permease [Sulfobacillus harzensis]|uniref:APC family permease n=1 Tax=Sulfobacillus harzensis TaxID=2729629 RepID=A0A7Y0L511_9FIRM|nr:APC family permease [Sulfobacillus harzensis]NMP23203.1 APC family permease [Sulfobacillus harzensis]